MFTINTKDCQLAVHDQGPMYGRVVMFANSLGTEMRVWDPLLAEMADDLRIIRFDKRGHGLSDCPNAPYKIETLVEDAIAIAEALDLRDVTFVGLSIGGLIGQGLAAKRPDLLRALVLMDTAAKIGDKAGWNDRINAIEKDGIEGMADGILDRWFGTEMLANPNLSIWRNMLITTPQQGYIGCCHAIAGADFTTQTAELKMPVLAIAGSEDGATPPELVRATADLCGAEFHEVAGAGHIPCAEKPREVAKILTQFLKDT